MLNVAPSKHSKPPKIIHKAHWGCTETQSQEYPCRAKRLSNYFQNWRRQDRLSDESMSSRTRFSLVSLGSHQSLSRKDHSPPPKNPRYDQETFLESTTYCFNSNTIENVKNTHLFLDVFLLIHRHLWVRIFACSTHVVLGTNLVLEPSLNQRTLGTRWSGCESRLP